MGETLKRLQRACESLWEDREEVNAALAEFEDGLRDMKCEVPLWLNTVLPGSERTEEIIPEEADRRRKAGKPGGAVGFLCPGLHGGESKVLWGTYEPLWVGWQRLLGEGWHLVFKVSEGGLVRWNDAPMQWRLIALGILPKLTEELAERAETTVLELKGSLGAHRAREEKE